MILPFLSVWDSWVAHSHGECGNGTEGGCVVCHIESLRVDQVSMRAQSGPRPCLP